MSTRGWQTWQDEVDADGKMAIEERKNSNDHKPHTVSLFEAVHYFLRNMLSLTVTCLLPRKLMSNIYSILLHERCERRWSCLLLQAQIAECLSLLVASRLCCEMS